jgi:hypothetical protein
MTHRQAMTWMGIFRQVLWRESAAVQQPGSPKPG